MGHAGCERPDGGQLLRVVNPLVHLHPFRYIPTDAEELIDLLLLIPDRDELGAKVSLTAIDGQSLPEGDARLLFQHPVHLFAHKSYIFRPEQFVQIAPDIIFRLAKMSTCWSVCVVGPGNYEVRKNLYTMGVQKHYPHFRIQDVDEVSSLLHHPPVDSLSLLQVGLRPLHPCLQVRRDAALLHKRQDTNHKDSDYQGCFSDNMADIDPVDRLRDLADRRSYCHGPQASGWQCVTPDGCKGNQFGDASFHAPVPAALIKAHAFFTPQHKFLHDPVNLGEADVRLPLCPGGESILADKGRFRMIEEHPALIDDPGISGPAGTNISCYAGYKTRDVQACIERTLPIDEVHRRVEHTRYHDPFVFSGFHLQRAKVDLARGVRGIHLRALFQAHFSAAAVTTDLEQMAGRIYHADLDQPLIPGPFYHQSHRLFQGANLRIRLKSL